MSRHFYYVVDVGSEWEVRSGLRPEVAARRFPNQAEAVAAAAALARDDWQLLGRPTGIRVPDLLGQWRDEITFGDDARRPSSHAAPGRG